MKAVSFRGPWAFYEQQNEENVAKIQSLHQEVEFWQQRAKSAEAELAQSQKQGQQFLHDEAPQLKEENSRARYIIYDLESHLAQQQELAKQTKAEHDKQVEILREEMEHLTAATVLLKAELSKTQQVRQRTNSKVEEARRKLGLTSAEAESFIKELDDAHHACKMLKAENIQLTADKEHLRQQCDSRSQHCMTLITENKRLVDQAADLRRQVVDIDGKIWDFKQQVVQLQSQNKKLSARKMELAAAHADRPSWQDGPAKPAKAGSLSLSQARPKVSPVKKPKPTGRSSRACSAATGPSKSPPLGIKLSGKENARVSMNKPSRESLSPETVEGSREPLFPTHNIAALNKSICTSSSQALCVQGSLADKFQNLDQIENVSPAEPSIEATAKGLSLAEDAFRLDTLREALVLRQQQRMIQAAAKSPS